MKKQSDSFLDRIIIKRKWFDALTCTNVYVYSFVFSAENVMPKTMSADLLKALQGVCYIAQHIKDADKDKEVRPC